MAEAQKPRKKRRLLKALLIIVIVLVVIRLILPPVILHFANRQLASMDGYYGHIKDIDLALLRGAYKVDSIYLNKVDSVTQKQTPFFAASLVDMSIEWKALMKGSLVGNIKVNNGLLRFAKDKVEPKEVVKDSSSFKDMLDKVMPLQINRFEINNGRLEYVDDFSKPKVDIALTNAYVLALNLRNKYDSASVLPATVIANADVYEGKLSMKMKLDPLADDPTFDMNAELKNTNLVKLNEFFQAYAKVDVNKGKFGLYTEVAGKNGKFEGYVKPVIKDLDILGKEDRKDNVLQKAWEGLAGLVGKVFENKPKDQVATKIPFKGDLKGTDSNIWFAVSRILQNAFIQAIQPSIDNQISLATVGHTVKEKKTFLEKVFGKKDDDKKDKKEDKKKN
jgi:hypothetical protein